MMGDYATPGETSTCYYCGRTLVCVVPLSQPKYHAFLRGHLTCGPCVHVHGRLPWRTGEGRGESTYNRRRAAQREALRDA